MQYIQKQVSSLEDGIRNSWALVRPSDNLKWGNSLMCFIHVVSFDTLHFHVQAVLCTSSSCLHVDFVNVCYSMFWLRQTFLLIVVVELGNPQWIRLSTLYVYSMMEELRRLLVRLLPDDYWNISIIKRKQKTGLG